MLIIPISIMASGIFSKELKLDDMKNYRVCMITKTGVAPYEGSFELITSTLRKSGVKTTIAQSGNDLYMEIGYGKDALKLEFVKIDSGELKQQGIICFEPQSVEGDKGQWTKKDGTLNENTFTHLLLFGRMLPTEEDKRVQQSKEAKARADTLLKAKQETLEKERIQQEIEKKHKKDMKTKRDIRKIKRAKLLKKKKEIEKIANDFWEKYDMGKWVSGYDIKGTNAMRNYYQKNVIVTDEFIDDLLDFYEIMNTKLPEAKLRNLKYHEKMYDWNNYNRTSSKGSLSSNLADDFSRIRKAISELR